MNKRGMFYFGCVLIVFVLVSILAAAQDESDEVNKIDKAYKCLEKEIDNKESLSLQDAVFSVLALGENDKSLNKIKAEKKSDGACWPKSGCKIKETAQVLLAYDRIEKDSEDIKKWILSKSVNAKDLTWYLEIDIQSHKSSECRIKYDSADHTINIRDDMKLEGNPGGCFDISFNGYWLAIKEKCLDKDFEISCNDDFVTALVYQKKGGNSIFVNSKAQLTSGGSSVIEKVNSKCFGTDSRCDYEGTLWAAIVFEEINEDNYAYMPYLLGFADENQKYMPAAFLYMLTAGDEYYAELVQKQKQGKYWSVIGSQYNQFYDSALALLALMDSGTLEVSSAKEYLLSVQTKEGCWNNNNVRDSAFILYSAWQREANRKISPGTGTSLELCESGGYYCELMDECLNIGGSVLEQYTCQSFRKCCTKKVILASCDDKKGIICSASQQCEGRIEPSSDGSCCIGGACIEKKPQNECSVYGGSCESSCLIDEEDIGKECPDYGDVCCKKKEISSGDGGIDKEKNNWTWIIVLGILILIVLILILYRKKIQMWIYKRRAGKRAGRETPRGPPSGAYRFSAPRFGARYPIPRISEQPREAASPRVTKGEKSSEDKELEETMKKLKEMSK